MALSLFGFTLLKSKEEDEKNRPTFIPPSPEGSLVVAEGSFYGQAFDLNAGITIEADLIAKYREMAEYPDVDYAIDDIVNEAISIDEDGEVVRINMENFKEESVFAQEDIQDKIRRSFDRVIELLDFNNSAHRIFRQWYVDGRIYYHIIVDQSKPKEGIKELRYIHPGKIRKIKEVRKTTDPKTGAPTFQTKGEYYVYSTNGFGQQTNNGFTGTNGITGIDSTVYGLKIAKDSVAYAHSGLYDKSGNVVLSHLHKAMRTLNSLKALEDSLVIYRLVRAPERRVFYIDVGNLPKQKAEQYLRDMMVRHKNKLIYDSSNGTVKDDRRFMCYALDTRIPLLDGRTLTLQEIMDEYEAGKKNWVYSADPKTGKFSPGPVSWAGITKRQAEVVRVTFDNGKSVVCTPDHKFPVWGKGMVEAKDLVGESIIPGYRRMKRIGKDGNQYEQIFRNDTKTWEFTHREVTRWKDENGLREEMVYDQSYADGPKLTIHHKNYKRLDNSPENLLWMNRYDHIKYHANCARGNFRKNRSEDFTPEWRAKISASWKHRTPKCKTWKVTDPTGEQLVIENLSAFCRTNGLNRSNIKGRFGSKGWKAEELRNHKAVSVELLNVRMDVGCLTVDLEETFHSNHTYLLDAGVYTKNTMHEDYWLPRREGGKGTQIDTLQGAQNLGVIDDVEYFKKDLYRALNVPISRMNPETSGFTFSKAAEISRDEVKFSRFVDRLRRQFATLLFEILNKQLILTGVMAVEDIPDFQNGAFFEFMSDNHFAEVKDNEILSRRIEVAKDMQDFVGKYFSHDYVRRHVFRQDDEEIEKMDDEIKEEEDDPRYEEKPDGSNGIDVMDPTANGNMGGFPGMPMPGQPGMPMPGQPGMAGMQQQPPQGPQPINSQKEIGEENE